MRKNITQDKPYRQSPMKYAAKCSAHPSPMAEVLYPCHSPCSLDDFAKQPVIHNRRSNNLPTRRLACLFSLDLSVPPIRKICFFAFFYRSSDAYNPILAAKITEGIRNAPPKRESIAQHNTALRYRSNAYQYVFPCLPVSCDAKKQAVPVRSRHGIVKIALIPPVSSDSTSPDHEKAARKAAAENAAKNPRAAHNPDKNRLLMCIRPMRMAATGQTAAPKSARTPNPHETS